MVRIVRVICASALLATGLAWGRNPQHSTEVPPPTDYVVRVAYVIPSDRKAQENYQEKASILLGRIEAFYAEQMECNGFGPKTFHYEAASNGRPEIHLIHSTMTAAVFADTGHARYVTGKYWEHARQAVIDGGFNSDAAGEIWLCFVEAQDQLADGSIHNDTTQGTGSFGNGFALCSGLELSVGGDPNLIHDHRKYGGLVVPQFGPHPLILHKSFPDYEGDDVSSLAADVVSATAHEIGHAFLLEHCYLNDSTQCGNLMGNGYRGWRGYIMPNRFPTEDTRLARPSALMLSLCPFLSAHPMQWSNDTPPSVKIGIPEGPMKLEKGKLHIPFTASDPAGPGISLAILENGQGHDNVGVVAWQEFDGKSKQVKGDLSTTIIVPGQSENWRLTVMDRAGNVASQSIQLMAPETGIGPSPFISVDHTRVRAGAKVTFKGSVRRPWKFRYEWTFGDGSATEGAAVDHVFKKPGVYEVHLKVTDPGGRVGEISIYICAKDAPLADG